MSIINPNGKDIIAVSTDFCGKKLTLEVNRVGFRTTASVLVTYGDTVVLGTAMVGTKPVVLDYFPLSIDYEEKMYAAGKISGSRFIKREGRPSDEAILIGRLIDRPIRPLFPKGYRQEVQVVSSVLSMDPNFRPDMVAMIAASAALMLTGTPFDGPVAGLRVGRVAGEFKAFLTPEERAASDLDLVVAGIESGITMVEAGANEVAEDVIIDAMRWAFEAFQPAIALQHELAKKVAPVAQEYDLVLPDETIQKEVDQWVEGKLGAALRKAYPERNELINELRWSFHEAMTEKVGDDYSDAKDEYDEAFTMAVHKDVRDGIVKDGVRPDGRKLDEIRPLSSEVGLLPRAHGSSLFTRGVTQGLNIVTLAPLSFAQIVDTMEVTDGERRYMHHYNAPGYTVGEVRRLGSPGRREIGHGYLAERALIPVLPTEEEFPYAIRSVTEIMSQNGSTSMAATCSSCLALMDAGVPIKRPVSGIAMGLMVDGDTHYVLSDIADAEDFAGDMDFKVTGTEQGITAVQMDMKVHGLPVEVLADAIRKAGPGRQHILEHMKSTLAGPRQALSPYAPRIEKIKINPDKIGAVIGKGGEVINKITSETGAMIDIKDDGLITVASSDTASIEKALEWIRGLTEEPEVGKIYTGKVVTIKDFGAFVNIMPGTDGMLHISQLSDKRVEKVTDILKEGQIVNVLLSGIDEKGRLSLTMKGVSQDQL
ncbi:putative polynucleotide phosphorylase (PNPase) [Candidatus Saccharimonas aalborgensis]|uniref:Polyribonucleotide nucleotidyltransferase n=1 Tax=Candidatus Saccharimonas aalborgensis TaxID=1332188 RepID=R4PL78_9BACT|nr:polyribonucleotide nucleotidyltransferase [Candidatus Saccharimonas aalborgensis]AGL62333.1 putative polynucleotide phosphorylase (PNPase) [Candidatus Saccharimonas aalborgensis]MBP7775224.1 polyribonucleotide nucleotidyltransferase [Candidatus Saccharimonas sp.]QQR51086.1 MAG: polyribonucleotide nucleotidyltransferase [Candidatus Saccharibacteria bacterium]QQS71118.1 MAG: polyribonucleotide nucleotidyltransferase [Candidatus Saccharibacteria bacterium]